MQTIKLNLVPSGVSPVVYVSRYDVGREFVIELYDGLDPCDLTNKTIVCQGVKPDKHSFAYTAGTAGNISADGNIVKVTTTEQMTAVSGDSNCELVVRYGSTVIGSLNFTIHVDDNVIPDDADSSASDLEAYQQMIANTWDAKAGAEKIETLVNGFKKGVLYKEAVTLSTSKWVNHDGYYTYDLGKSNDDIIDFMLDGSTASTAIINSAIDAGIVGSVNDSLLYAFGEKPTIDIPAVLVYREGGSK